MKELLKSVVEVKDLRVYNILKEGKEKGFNYVIIQESFDKNSLNFKYAFSNNIQELYGQEGNIYCLKEMVVL